MARSAHLLGILMLSAIPVAAAAQAFSLTVVEFAGGPDQLIAFNGAKVVAYDASDTPLFRADHGFLFGANSKLGNPAGRVFAWDLARKKVRVSAAGLPQVWLACSELKPMSLACSTTLRIANDGSLVISGTGLNGGKRGNGPMEADAATLARLPDCPGDPRCPS
ncbi:hypothetical protein [Sphingomonas sp.]|uniref:hypothetical protein n=1 Tax=Sphingomonas sp. TaxID=28214 RepID=UPI001DDD8979|nr:hypothetical protein [Sphingomonas sp.]MBX9797161.1 hypothetical protein [Sphingomonas sp.]